MADVSKRTVMVLLVLVLISTVVSAWAFLSAMSAPQRVIVTTPPYSTASADVQLEVLQPPVSFAEGQVTLEIVQNGG